MLDREKGGPRGLTVLALSWAAALSLAQAPRYDCQVIQNPRFEYTYGVALNNLGDVAGFFGPYGKRFIWSKGEGFSVIDDLANTNAEMQDMNDRREITGNVIDGYRQAYIWSPEEGLSLLGRPDGYGGTEGWQITNSGIVVAWAYRHPKHLVFAWSKPTGWQIVPGLPSMDITDSSNSMKIVGYYYDNSTEPGRYRGVLWTPEHGFQPMELPPGATGMTPYSVNEQGTSVGQVTMPSFDDEAFVRPINGPITYIPPKLPNSELYANAINSSNVVVGNCDSPRTRRRGTPFVWTAETGVLDLPPLIDNEPQGFVMTGCLEINEMGQILGLGIYRGRTVTCLLTPKIKRQSDWRSRLPVEFLSLIRHQAL